MGIHVKVTDHLGGLHGAGTPLREKFPSAKWTFPFGREEVCASPTVEPRDHRPRAMYPLSIREDSSVLTDTTVVSVVKRSKFPPTVGDPNPMLDLELTIWTKKHPTSSSDLV